MHADEIWRDLTAERPAAPGVVRRRVLPASDRDIFLAVVHPSRHPMLILRVDRTALKALTVVPSTRAVQTQIVDIDDAVSEIRVQLIAPEASRVFAPFVEDVAACVAARPDDGSAVDSLVDRFEHWRRLLSGAGAEGLGAEAAQGLWGELWVLRHLLHPVWSDDVVDAWTGPDRDDNDFRHHKAAVEVKTTRADNPETVRVDSERQLDNPAGTTLILIALSVDAHRHGAGESLPAMVDACRALIGHRKGPAFQDRLLAWGYTDTDRTQYDDRHYTLRSLEVFKVDDGFPRITESLLPTGIGSVNYRLALDACRSWLIDPTTQLRLLLNPEEP
jgi:hypothetical protein